MGWKGERVWTVGHSTRSLDELVALLRSFGIARLVDVRTVPRSRTNPQFNRETLGPALRRRGIAYAHLARLGGLRRARAGSPNAGWRNASFRGFADHMGSEEFEQGLAELRELAREGPLAVMCAEAVPWRCHRSLIADALVARGARVEHVTGEGRAHPHRMTRFARVERGRVTYPAGDDDEQGEPLATRAPFHLQATVRVLQRRPANLVDVWEDERYVRVLATPGGSALIEVRNAGTIDAPDLRLFVRAGDASDALTARARRVLGLDVDPEPLERAARAVPALRSTASALRGMRPPRFADLFETVASVIPFQQLSLDSGVATLARLVRRFGTVLEHGGRRRHAFPTAARIAAARLDSLRAAGLSRARALALRAAARAIQEGEPSEERLSALSTPDALRALRALPGIGPWSAALVLLRGLGRLDVLPPGDAGLARGLAELTRLDPAEVERRLERAGAQRGYLYFCALGGRLLAKGLIDPAPRARRAAGRIPARRRP